MEITVGKLTSSVLKTWRFVALTLLYCFSATLFANNSQPPEKLGFNNSTVDYYKDNNTVNQIPYFDNRFRIDSELEEITMIFYRKSGSTPVILVRPDGSKIRVNSFDVDKVQWYDDRTFDMIKIKKPMVGPWQAIGDILPESQIMVVSDVKIAVEPLPEVIFSGETLKITGQLFNGEHAITSTHFKEVVKLDVNFYSTNNSAYENFGADAIKITSFRDDGRGLDEYASDNLFTGEFVLKFSPGEWQPVYLVKLPMATRELRQKTIMLYKTPVSINVEASSEPEAPHKMMLTIDPTFVDVDSLIFQGKVTFPDRQLEPFSIMEATGDSRIEEITNTEPGLYRINASAFGKTLTGREFRLVIPEFTFNVEPTTLLLPNIGDSSTLGGDTSTSAVSSAALLEEQLLAQIAEKKLAQEEKEAQTLLIIAAGNSLVIIIALVTFLIMRKNKLKKVKQAKQQTKEQR